MVRSFFILVLLVILFYVGGIAIVCAAGVDGVSSHEASFDFGGMYGAPGSADISREPFFNPATGDFSCPSGYSSSQIAGVPSFDWPLHFCFRSHVSGRDPSYDFGGMYGGSVAGGLYAAPFKNPLTHDFSCPDTFSSAQVLGGNAFDGAVFFCYRQHSPGLEGIADFGGMFGGSMYKDAPQRDFINPATGALSCLSGFQQAQVLGAAGRDNAVLYCFKPRRSELSSFEISWLKDENVNSARVCPAQVGEFHFPEDERGHAAPVEWWYVNGHLKEQNGLGSYGFMVSFFAYRAQEVLGHFLFALSDNRQGKYYAYSKKLLPEQFFVHPERLELRYDLDNPHILSRSTTEVCAYALHVENPDEKAVLDLKMNPVKPPVLIGDNGYVPIGDGLSAYYAQPRILVEGSLNIGGLVKPVSGIAWIDRQWGSFDPRTIRWDWFSLQLDDLTEVELMRVYSRATGDILYSFLNYINKLGDVVLSKDVIIEPNAFWISPDTGHQYPSDWTISAADIAGGLQLHIKPVLMSQELREPESNNVIWEGNCTVRGSIDGREVSGLGYVEIIK